MLHPGIRRRRKGESRLAVSLGHKHPWDGLLSPLLLSPAAASTAELPERSGGMENWGDASSCWGDTAGGRKKEGALRASRGRDLGIISPPRNNIYWLIDLCSALISPKLLIPLLVGHWRMLPYCLFCHSWIYGSRLHKEAAGHAQKAAFECSLLLFPGTKVHHQTARQLFPNVTFLSKWLRLLWYRVIVMMWWEGIRNIFLRSRDIMSESERLTSLLIERKGINGRGASLPWFQEPKGEEK